MLMKPIALLSAGAAVVVAAVIAVPALAVGTAHTLHLTATRLQFVNTSATTFVETDAVFRAGKKAGYETISCDDGCHQIVCSMSVALEDGMLVGHVTIPITSGNTSKVAGKVTGGLGRFKGDKGTIKGTITGKHSTMTVTYRS